MDTLQHKPILSLVLLGFNIALGLWYFIVPSVRRWNAHQKNDVLCPLLPIIGFTSALALGFAGPSGWFVDTNAEYAINILLFANFIVGLSTMLVPARTDNNEPWSPHIRLLLLLILCLFSGIAAILLVTTPLY